LIFPAPHNFFIRRNVLLIHPFVLAYQSIAEKKHIRKARTRFTYSIHNDGTKKIPHQLIPPEADFRFAPA